MKIGIDCRLWQETGVGRYIRNLVNQLQRIDQKNEYVLFVISKDYEYVKSKITNPKWTLIEADVRWHSVEEQIKMPIILKREDLDLVHFPYISVPLFYNRPYIVTIHDLIQNHYASGRASTLPFFFYYLKKMGYQKVLKNAISKAKQIIVPLVSVKSDLINTLRVSGDKIVVTPEGFDPNIKSGKVSEYVQEASANPYFLYVGNAYPHKNLERLIDGYNRAKSKVKLFLVIKKDYFYKRLEKKRTSDIIFLHDVSDADLFHLYSHAVGCVSASLMEGFGLFPLEALGAGGIPVVSDISAFREVCGDLAIYFDPTNEKDIAEKLIKIAKLKESEREEIRKKAKEWIKKFSWEKMARETMKVYESCASL